MPKVPSPSDEPPHDVLAADEFEIPAPDPVLHERAGEAHDVLAAEEFAVGAADPVLHERAGEAHDVLAAEEFAVGGADPVLTRRPFVPPANPADPGGTEKPHDVLAAEEFAMPAPPLRHGPRSQPGRRGQLTAAGLFLLVLLIRGRRRP